MIVYPFTPGLNSVSSLRPKRIRRTKHVYQLRAIDVGRNHMMKWPSRRDGHNQKPTRVGLDWIEMRIRYASKDNKIPWNVSIVQVDFHGDYALAWDSKGNRYKLQMRKLSSIFDR